MTSLMDNLSPKNGQEEGAKLVEIKRNRFLSDDIIQDDEAGEITSDLKPIEFVVKGDENAGNFARELTVGAQIRQSFHQIRKSIALEVKDVASSINSDSQKIGKLPMMLVFGAMVLLNFGCLFVYDFP